MNIIASALTRFAFACATERQQHRSGYSLRVEDLEAWASDDGATVNVMGAIAGVPVGTSIGLPSQEFPGTTREWIEQAMHEAAHTVEAGFRPGAIRLATVRCEVA